MMNKRRIVMLSRWNGWEMKCACLQGNPLCECYKECEEIEVTIKPYQDIEECLRNQRKYKRVNGALRQK
ncbi:hypothetical protein [Clostridium perfringens]|uniref:Uncharacterized protein n=2 Tax=root TaxID=1 RepID=A0A8S5PPC7_9CAUD|nr:hypothetical protein [Clostridium perfringens]DAE09015.1 MAG TPA: hypothetical protein [Siphoviridae sp. ct16M3]